METSLDAYNSEGQFKVTCGHPTSNGLPLLYGHETWRMESLDAKQGLPLLYGHETWWMESSLDANNSEGQFKVTCGHLMSNGLPLLYGGVTQGQHPHTIPKQPNLVTTFAEPPFI